MLQEWKGYNNTPKTFTRYFRFTKIVLLTQPRKRNDMKVENNKPQAATIATLYPLSIRSVSSHTLFSPPFVKDNTQELLYNN